MQSEVVYLLVVTTVGFLFGQSGYQACKHKQWFRLDVAILQLLAYAILRAAFHKP